MDWDSSFDIVCVGSGIGGLSAALTGAQSGARVVVLEKFVQLGGVSALSSGQLWLGPNHLAEEAGMTDSMAAANAYLGHLNQGFAVPALRDVYFEHSRQALRYFTDVIGLEMQVVRGLPDYYYPLVDGSAAQGRYVEIKPFAADRLGDLAHDVLASPYGDGYSYTTSNEWIDMQDGGAFIGDRLAQHLAAGERCAGAGLAAAQVVAAVERGVALHASSEVVRLVVEDGEVRGVIMRDALGDHAIQARLGVVLATGGYDWRADLVRAFDALPQAGSMAPPSITGDHFALAAAAGALPLPARAPSQTPIFLGYAVPGENIYGQASTRMWLPGAPHSIVVNRKGQRFADDSFYPDLATRVARFDGQEGGLANWPAWIIFDQDMLDKYGLLPAWPGQPLPDGMAISAPTLEALAGKTGIALPGLCATVESFNDFCADGVDHDFGRGKMPWPRIMTGDPRLPHPNMAPIARAPFHAVPLMRVTMGVPTAGLPIDMDGQVIDPHGKPICGLYAAGNAAAWLDWGGGYNSGIANMRGMLYGHRAALAMTRQQGEEE
ncbi:3-oxosteroid 1-dehydrogenase [Sphingobium sp. AntQ-1]|uniref:FAD-dependent oxidoreductase n=1 Tax=Sphingobium sp. AntQ-1 TaxID=2930091 RepID=UPI00234E410D|nr:FAD-dependent oxidoreductase [Sphingobium sp. AntQ-1]WCP15423.1 3-oxosteroid 1-dehydrogenase [Sphingobium sp. AntQ-1]